MNDMKLNENLSENMDREEIRKKVIEITASKLLKDGNASDIQSGSNFIEDLKADSLDIVELVMAFEEAFNCEIPDDVAEKIKTVQDAIDYIVENQK